MMRRDAPLSREELSAIELWLVKGANHGNARDTAGAAIFDERVSTFLDKVQFVSDVDLAHGQNRATNSGK